MSGYDDTNRGVLFFRKAEGKQPNYAGTINVLGEEYEISAWDRVSKSGHKYISLVIKPKVENKPQSKDDDDIPF